MRIYIGLLVVFTCVFTTLAQDMPSSTSAIERAEGNIKKKALLEKSYLNEVPATSIGPSIFSGRVVDLNVNPSDPSHFYVAYASGGLWKTESNGTRFKPIFENQPVMTIGAIAVDWEGDDVWVGTGEVNSSRSSYAGNGIYHSNNGGETWSHLGLEETHHIGRIILDSERKNKVYVAALGHLYSDNMERGVYISDDYGKTWKQSLFINDKTGVVDIVQDVNDPNILYASAWERKRFAWNFIESGSGSAIYKSVDRGETWKCMTCNNEGFPNGEGVGRIGLDLSNDNGNTKIYAILDNYFRRPKNENKTDKLDKDAFKDMDLNTFQVIENEKLEEYLRENGFLKKYDAKRVKELVEAKKISVVDLSTYLEDANKMLFDTPVIGAEVYSSTDNGVTWTKTHDYYLDQVYNSYGYYFGQIRANKSDPDEIYIMGVPILKSKDGGKTFENINGDNVHVDHHALWINPHRKGHLINGNDGGVNISYDYGNSWYKCNNPPVGQFYSINADIAEPYNVYGGTQDNGVWMGSKNYQASDGWHNTGRYPYKSIMGGDGTHVQIDSRDNSTVYTGFQFGNYFRINTDSETRKYITPKHDLGETPFRWNWQSPILISKHNQDIIYLGGNKLFRSMDQGDNFEAISDDLTLGGKKGDVPYGTLTCIDESELKFGLVYTGSDDGLLYVSKNGGHTWTQINGDLPQQMWVSRVQASKYFEGRVYTSLNGYRWDNFNSMVYTSEDYGANWTQIGLNLPHEPVNVIKEDPFDENILYVGTDHGVYLSFDRGVTFTSISKHLPSAPVHDLVVHPKEGDLIIGTHGRSIYTIDMKPIRTWLESGSNAEDFQFLSAIEILHSAAWGSQRNVYSDIKKPKVVLEIFAPAAKTYSFSLQNTNKKNIKTWSGDLEKGINFLEIDITIPEKSLKHFKKEQELTIGDDGHYYLPPGDYTILCSGKSAKMNIKLKE